MLYEQQHYKEISPEKTVEKLRDILTSCGINLSEQWVEKSSINTYSLRVTIKGTNIGTNGKGVSKNYARASAYAEFFERFQNGALSQHTIKGYAPYAIANDERKMTIEELLEHENPYFNNYFDIRGMRESSVTEKANAFRSVRLADDGDKYISLPFYDLRSKRTVYLPYFSYISIYGSNGMCAGNTSYEAIVQGLSEIFERVAQKRIFTERPSLPAIPDEYVKNYPYIYEMYEKTRSNPRFFVRLLDCSFGGSYPVAALIVIEKNTGRYGLKLGCHPNMGIAMERTFTEMCQGMDIYEFARSRSLLDFTNNGVNSASNITNSYKIGLAQYPFELFYGNNTYKFTEMPDVSKLSNAEIAKKWISDLLDEYDILIRDVSFTGFPSYHIIIPGVSDLIQSSDYDIRMQNTRVYVSKLLLTPEKIKREDLKYITAVLRLYNKSSLENTLNTYYPSDVILNLPFGEISADLYLLAMCYVAQNDYAKALECISVVRKRAIDIDADSEMIEKLTGIYYYISGRTVMKTHDDVIKYLGTFFGQNICLYLDSLFSNQEDVIRKQYSDVIVERLPYYRDFMGKISDKFGKTVINQTKIGEMFN